MNKLIIAFLGLSLLAASPVSAGEALNGPTKLTADQAHAQSQVLVTGAAIDLSHVTIVRFRAAGEMLDVVSVRPWINQADTADNPDVTVMTFTPDRKALVMLTATKQEGWRLEVPVANLVRGYKISFPMLDSAGKPANRELEVVEVRTAP